MEHLILNSLVKRTPHKKKTFNSDLPIHQDISTSIEAEPINNSLLNLVSNVYSWKLIAIFIWTIFGHFIITCSLSFIFSFFYSIKVSYIDGFYCFIALLFCNIPLIFTKFGAVKLFSSILEYDLSLRFNFSKISNLKRIFLTIFNINFLFFFISYLILAIGISTLLTVIIFKTPNNRDGHNNFFLFYIHNNIIDFHNLFYFIALLLFSFLSAFRDCFYTETNYISLKNYLISRKFQIRSNLKTIFTRSLLRSAFDIACILIFILLFYHFLYDSLILLSDSIIINSDINISYFFILTSFTIFLLHCCCLYFHNIFNIIYSEQIPFLIYSNDVNMLYSACKFEKDFYIQCQAFNYLLYIAEYDKGKRQLLYSNEYWPRLSKYISMSFLQVVEEIKNLGLKKRIEIPKKRFCNPVDPYFHLFTKLQLLHLMLKFSSSFAAKAMFEDKIGVVQYSLNELLSSMIDLSLALDELPLLVPPVLLGEIDAFESPLSLYFCLNNCLYLITQTYSKSLYAFSFSHARLSRLKEFMSFKT